MTMKTNAQIVGRLLRIPWRLLTAPFVGAWHGIGRARYIRSVRRRR